MQTAIIVIASILGFGLIMFFVSRCVFEHKKKVRLGAPRKKGWAGVKEWFVNHVPSKRRLIQVYAMLLYNANIKGYITGNIYTSETTKYMCVPGLNCYSCPGAVGACPLGALQNALSESKTRAPYYVLGILALFGIMLARTICGFLCPVGLCQELLYKIRTPKLKKSRVTRVLSYFKYVLLALTIALPVIYAAFHLPLPAFCKYICPAGTLGGAVMLLMNPNNSALFGQLGWQFTWKFSLLVALVVASVFIYRVFCRFFCPLGAIYGFFNKFSIIGVHVDKGSCTDCGLCVAHCKMDVKHVGDHECINCGECISVCPTKALSWKGSKLFLRGSAVTEKAPELKPVTVAGGVATLGGSVPTETPVQPEIVKNTENLSVSDVAATVDTAVPPTNVGAQVLEETPAAAEQTPKAQKPRKPVKFWLELAAWIAALVVLVTALVCYNFVDTEKPVEPPSDETGYEVGDTAPDFTVKLYGADGEFNLYANRGKVTIVNFWATWCTPCVEELPYFNELAVNRPDITVVAVHGSGSSFANVEKFIDAHGWRDYALTFVQDNLDGAKCTTFLALGGTSLWPMTVIVGADGKIVYNSTQSFHSYEQLAAEIEKLGI